MRIIEKLHSTNGSYNESSFSRRLLDVFKNKDLIELRQKLKKLSIQNHGVRINEDVLAKSNEKYLEETLSLLINEIGFNERILPEIGKLKPNTSTYREYVKAKEISDEEILSQQRNLNDRFKKYLKQSNVKINSYLTMDKIMFTKNVYNENEGSLINQFWPENSILPMINLKSAHAINLLKTSFLSIFIEEYKQDGKVDYPKVINYMIDTWRWFCICRYFRDFEKIRYEDFKIIVENLRKQNVSGQDINTFIYAYSRRQWKITQKKEG